MNKINKYGLKRLINICLKSFMNLIDSFEKANFFVRTHSDKFQNVVYSQKLNFN